MIKLFLCTIEFVLNTSLALAKGLFLEPVYLKIIRFMYPTLVKSQSTCEGETNLGMHIKRFGNQKENNDKNLKNMHAERNLGREAGAAPHRGQ